MENKSNNIFISYSKTWTGDLANKIESIFRALYRGKNVKIFFDKKNAKGGILTDILNENLGLADVGILLLTPENYSKEWLMFEAGALTQVLKAKGGILVPYLFCRDPNQREHPISSWHFTKYIYQGADQENYQGLIDLFLYVDNALDEENRIGEITIGNLVYELWSENSLKHFLHDLAKNLSGNAAAARDKALLNSENHYVSLTGMKTNEQYEISLLAGQNHINAQTPRQLEKQFEEKIEEIPKKLIHQTDEEKTKFNATRVMVNNTRFSTFVAFTDSKRIVLFDRKKANPDDISVTNDRYDVFGSVQFENRTLNKKISSQSFLDAPIKKIREINGAAIENNEWTDSDNPIYTRETAVMFGICVYMEPEDLDLATKDTKSGKIVIKEVSEAIACLKSSQLTSKAQLAARYIALQSK